MFVAHLYAPFRVTQKSFSASITMLILLAHVRIYSRSVQLPHGLFHWQY